MAVASGTRLALCWVESGDMSPANPHWCECLLKTANAFLIIALWMCLMKVGDLANFTLPENRQTVALLVELRVTDTGIRIWSIIEGGETYEVRESWLKERK